MPSLLTSRIAIASIAERRDTSLAIVLNQRNHLFRKNRDQIKTEDKEILGETTKEMDKEDTRETKTTEESLLKRRMQINSKLTYVPLLPRTAKECQKMKKKNS